MFWTCQCTILFGVGCRSCVQSKFCRWWCPSPIKNMEEKNLPSPLHNSTPITYQNGAYLPCATCERPKNILRNAVGRLPSIIEDPVSKRRPSNSSTCRNLSKICLGGLLLLLAQRCSLFAIVDHKLATPFSANVVLGHCANAIAMGRRSLTLSSVSPPLLLDG